jgi:formylglycine-generating enzyme required for sulfatase activity
LIVNSAKILFSLICAFVVLLALPTVPPAAAQQPSPRQNSIGMAFVYVPPGSFIMGINDVELARWFAYDKKVFGKDAQFDWYDDEIPQHRVSIPRGFWLGRFEVTQAQWTAVTGNNPSHFKDCAACPVEGVTWNGIKDFISRLNAKGDGYTYRLPTEAEWEYAARAGTTTPFAFGDSLSSAQANFDGNYPFGGAPKGRYLAKPAPVGGYQPNAWGLYDMHGNVWELVEDIHSDNYLDLPTDGSANLSVGDPNTRVERGGSWQKMAWFCRSFNRAWATMNFEDNETGFRLVAVPAR